MLQKPEHAGAFRLKALADAFFEPLQAALGDKQYLLGSAQPAPVDCLAYGYLSLMLYPELPQAWLETTLRRQYPKLVTYIENLTAELNIAASSLPWTPPPRKGVLDVASYVGLDLFHRIPFLERSDRISIEEDSLKRKTAMYRYGVLAVGLASASLAGLTYWAYLNGLWPQGEPVQVFGRRRLAHFGEAGAVLGALGSQLRSQSTGPSQEDSPVHVDVVVDDATLP